MQNVAPDHDNVHRKCSDVQEHIEGCEPVYEIYVILEVQVIVL